MKVSYPCVLVPHGLLDVRGVRDKPLICGVFAVVALRAEHADGWCCSLQTLAEEVERSRSLTAKALGWLVQNGWILRDSRPGHSSTYRLPDWLLRDMAEARAAMTEEA